MKITPIEIQNSCARIKCGEETGTGFFVAPSILITARHVIADYETDEVEIEFVPEGSDQLVICAAKVVSESWDLDVALLKLEADHKSKKQLGFIHTLLRYHDRWDTYGYPFGNLNNGQRFYGKIINFNHASQYDLLLNCKDIDATYDYSGLSGAPLVTSDGISGIITWSTAFGLGAISTKMIRGFLDDNLVPVDDLHERYLFPEEFAQELDRTEINEEVFKAIDDKLENDHSYYLLQGSPGSGKSVISASFEPNNELFEVVGRYLIRVPGDHQPVVVKVNRENILLWVEDLIQQTLVGEITPNADLKIDVRLSRISNWFTQLGEHYQKMNLTGIIIIDGLDEILLEGSSTNEFLSIFPETLHKNLKVLFSCTSKSILAPKLASVMSSDVIVNVTPLSDDACWRYIDRELEISDLPIDASKISELISKTEGHPLYLRYLVELLKDNFPDDFESWLADLPTIGGDIAKYYENIWNSLVSIDPDRYWTCLTASQLRQPVNQERFVKMLPQLAQYSFAVKFPSFRHLFKNSPEIALHHSSFNLFISSKGQQDLKNVHDNIAVSNDSIPDEEYSVTNLIHHLLRSNNPKNAIERCDQNWTDRCALIHMHPDLIIDDIKETELICIQNGDVPALVSIKLLLSRMNFRYDNVLAKHAYEIADTLIDLKMPQHALKYLLRRNLLLISLEDAMEFLKKLYETGAINEAKKLFSAIELRIHERMDAADKIGQIDILAAADQIRLLTLGSNHLSKKTVALAFGNFMKAMSEIADSEGISEEDSKYIFDTKNYVFAWFFAYNMYRYHYYNGVATMSSASGVELGSEWTGLFAMVSVNYYHFLGDVQNTKPIYRNLISDIELLLEKHGLETGTEKLVLDALLEESKRPDLVEPIAKSYTQYKGTFDIRETNGVDADLQAVTEYLNCATYLGYVDSSSIHEAIPVLTQNNWEQLLALIIRKLGYLNGKAIRTRAENKTTFTELTSELDKILTALSFSLKERINWDRSYGLVESILPKIYGCISHIFLEFFPSHLDTFLNSIRKRMEDQLGMYSEGFRKVMSALIDRLIGYSKIDEASELLLVLEKHVNEAVQNRWERTPELLKLVSQYSRAGNPEHAKKTYQKMLNTSMGPTWYKEDQFFMVETAIKHAWTRGSGLEKLQEFASYLDYASGELTFQRYVQQAMDGFPAALATSGNLRKASEYIKFTTMPEASKIYSNAHSSKIDTPTPGNGYILGANQIIVASAMGELLCKLDRSDPFIILALAEAFIVNHDTDRYLHKYIKALSMALQRPSLSQNDILLLIDRIVDLIAYDELSHFLSRCIDYFYEELDDEIFGLLKTRLLQIGVEEESFIFPEKEEPRVYTEEDDATADQYNMNFPGVGKMSNLGKIDMYLQRASEAIKIGNKYQASMEIVECLTMLSEGGADIWKGRGLSSKNGELFDLLKENFTPSEAVILLKDLIIKHDTSDWIIADFIVSRFGQKVGDEGKQKIVTDFSEHIENLINSKGKLLDKYKWLASHEQDEDPDAPLIELLIWGLNYPSENVKLRVMRAIINYSKRRPEVLSRLHLEAMKDEGNCSSELSAFILKEILEERAGDLLEHIFSDQSMIGAISRQTHFIIRAYYYEILGHLLTVDEKNAEMETVRESLFPERDFIGTDVFMDDEIEATNDLVDQLNGEAILNKDFFDRFYQNMERISSPLTPQQQHHVEGYIRRSFFTEEIIMGSYEYAQRYAMNLALSKNVGREQVWEIKDIMELPILKYEF